MNGAESLIRTAVSSGVDLCLANPGTTEMQLVAALDGTATVEERVQAAAERLDLSDAESSRLRREVLDVCIELLELGALELA